MSTTIKATRATIKLGDIELDVFQLPDGSYGFSKNSLKEQFNILLGNSTGKKHAQPLIDKRPSLVQKFKIADNNATAHIIHIELFKEIVAAYAGLGNVKCIALLTACFAEALERRADSAFSVIRTEEERNLFLKARMEGKMVRRTLTDSIKEYISRHPELSEMYRRFVYSNCTDCINLVVLGAKSKQVKLELDLKPTGLLRDVIPYATLREIEAVEVLAGRLIDAEDLEPLEACKKALELIHARTLGFC
jgi:hypothetical protein